MNRKVFAFLCGVHGKVLKVMTYIRHLQQQHIL